MCRQALPSDIGDRQPDHRDRPKRLRKAISFSDARGTSTALAVVLGISAAGLFAWFWPSSFGNHDSISVVDSSDAVPGSRNKHRFGIPGISREATAGVISSVEVSVPEPSGSGHPQSVQIADKHLGSNKVAAEGQRGSSSDFVASSSARPADIPSRIPYSGTKPTTIAVGQYVRFIAEWPPWKALMGFGEQPAAIRCRGWAGSRRFYVGTVAGSY
jgi:hypothetical protein